MLLFCGHTEALIHTDPKKVEAVELGLGGLHPYQIMDVMETSHGGPGETGFLSQDL